MHKYIMALKKCLLEELEPVGNRSDVTANNLACDEHLHSSVQTFWDLFSSGQITQMTTCIECKNVSTKEELFSKWLLYFPQAHHEKDQNCTLNDFIHHDTMQGVLPNYMCICCNKQAPATLCPWISQYFIVSCIVLCCKKDNDISIRLAVKYPVWT